jgi:hypothetical protein
MPKSMVFESNIEYVRKVLAEQESLSSDLTEYVPVNSLPKDHRYFWYNSMVNGTAKEDGGVPTQKVITQIIADQGQDYRFETKPHPLSRFQDRRASPTY